MVATAGGHSIDGQALRASVGMSGSSPQPPAFKYPRLILRDFIQMTNGDVAPTPEKN